MQRIAHDIIRLLVFSQSQLEYLSEVLRICGLRGSIADVNWAALVLSEVNRTEKVWDTWHCQ